MCICSATFGQNNRLTLHLEKVSLGQFFQLIQQQSEFIIFYKDNQVNLSQLVSVNAKDKTINTVLDQALKGTGLTYKIFDRQIIIVPNKDENKGKSAAQLEREQQKRKVSGAVTDESGNPIPGATVVAKGTHYGILTDKDGQYVLSVPVNATTLVFSFVGLKKVEEKLTGRSVINAKLVPENYGVDEVIISALGIKRDEKALTYATQTISEEDISNNRGLNFINGLSGKISGIEINKSASGAGGSTKVILRGNKSLSVSSEPLFVIDGIPMANNKGEQIGMFGGTDGGDGLSQINIDDIGSITILKGANAAALYGSQGANGVILITTKKGIPGSTRISFSSGINFETIQKTPDLQFEYGGENGSIESWSTTKGYYAGDYVKDFFRTGTTLNNSLSLSGGNDRTTAYFTFSNSTINGVVPRNSYQKNNLTLRQSTQFLDGKASVSSTVMLTDEETRNKVTAGYYLNPLTGLYLFPRDKDFSYYKNNYQVFNKERNMYLQNWFVADHFQSNPYWIIYNEPREDITKRVIANVSVDYNILPHLKLQLRGSYDYAIRSDEQKNKAGSNATNVHPNGSWIYSKYTDELVYGDAILTYSKKHENFSFDGVLGSSYQKSKYGVGVSVNTGTIGLIYPNVFDFQNIDKNVLVNSIYGSSLIKEGVFGNLQIGYKEKLFADLSGRNDWASSLYGTGNDSYFYPSIGLTGIVTDLAKLPDFFSFGKVRSSYTIVANEVPFNKIHPNSTITSSGISINTTKPFSNLRPEMIHSFEVGTDWKLWKGLFGIDFTYYNINSKHQFIALPAPSGSGYTQYYVNAGQIINSGIEILVTSESLRTKNFGWSTTVNFSTNKNRIVSLHPDLKNPIILSDVEGYELIIKEGGSFGDIYVYKFQRDEQGRIKLDDKGNIMKTAKVEYVGNSNPKWALGLNNKLRYKNFELGFLFNGKFGGKVVSQTEAMLDGYGVSKRTAVARDNGGVTINAVMPDGTLVTKMDARQYYSTIGDRNGIKEPYTYNRTNIRLAQVLLSYDLNFKNKVIKQASFSLVGQNLFFLYKAAPFDPEITMNTWIIDQALDNFGLPSTRTFGFNLKVEF